MGLLVFVLLLFADKTNLNDDSAADLGSKGSTATVEGTPEQDGEALLSRIPPASPSEELAVQLTALQQETNADARAELLRAIVSGFRDQGRTDVAAVYAGMLADEVPDLKNHLVAGALFRNATHLPALVNDSTTFRTFSDNAIRNLEAAIKLDPENEDAKIELGLALIECRIPGQSMQGIFKIREVAEANPRNLEALFHLGKFSIDTGQFDKAEQRFRQILEAAPDNADAKYQLGLVVRQLGKTAEFQSLMSEVAQQDENPELAQAAQAALDGK